MVSVDGLITFIYIEIVRVCVCTYLFEFALEVRTYVNGRKNGNKATGYKNVII